VVGEVEVVVAYMMVFAPILTLPEIAAPPFVINDPLDKSVEIVLEETLTLPPIPTPPTTINAPLLLEVDAVFEVILK